MAGAFALGAAFGVAALAVVVLAADALGFAVDALAAGALVVVALALGAALVAAALVAAALVVAALVVAALAVVGLAGVSTGAATGAAAACRVVLDSAARALPAAVCSPLALVALPAAMRALAALTEAGLAGLPRDLARGHGLRACQGCVHLEHQPALATGCGVGVDGTDLGGAIERRDGQDHCGLRLLGLAGPGSHEGALDQRLGSRAARLEDRVATLGLAHALLALGRARAGPGAGRVSQVGIPRM